MMTEVVAWQENHIGCYYQREWDPSPLCMSTAHAEKMNVVVSVVV